MTTMNKSDMQHLIAKRVAQELEGPCVVNLGIGIPTLVAEYMDAADIYMHTENGLLGVTDVEESRHRSKSCECWKVTSW